MIDLIRKAMLTGVGLASISIDKVEAMTKDLIEQGNLTEQEGRKLAQEMMGYAEKSKKMLEEQVSFYVEQTMTKMDVAKKSDLEELKEMVLQLQAKIDDNSPD